MGKMKHILLQLNVTIGIGIAHVKSLLYRVWIGHGGTLKASMPNPTIYRRSLSVCYAKTQVVV